MIDIGGGFRIIERHEWGARRARNRVSYSRSRHGGKTAHYSTGEELGVEDTAQWVRNIQTYHMDTRRWDDVGYHFLYDRDGNIFAGRPLLTVGAHAGHTDGNRTAGCCFLGDDDPGQDVPDIARSALAHLSAYIDRQTREGPWFGHRDWKNTPCPGDEIYAFLPHLDDYLEDDMQEVAQPDWLPDATIDQLLRARVLTSRPDREPYVVWRTYAFLARTLDAAGGGGVPRDEYDNHRHREGRTGKPIG